MFSALLQLKDLISENIFEEKKSEHADLLFFLACWIQH